MELGRRRHVFRPGAQACRWQGPGSAAPFAVRSTGVVEDMRLGVRGGVTIHGGDRPRQETHDLRREQVYHAWLVEPIARTLEVLQLERDRWTIVANWSGFGVLRAEPFEAIELDLSLLWEEA